MQAIPWGAVRICLFKCLTLKNSWCMIPCIILRFSFEAPSIVHRISLDAFYLSLGHDGRNARETHSKCKTELLSTSSIGTIYFALVEYSAENLSFVSTFPFRLGDSNCYVSFTGAHSFAKSSKS